MAGNHLAEWCRLAVDEGSNEHFQSSLANISYRKFKAF